jgi:hypothetical protein
MSGLDKPKIDKITQDKPGELQIPERLNFTDSSGVFRYGRVPYDIHYDLNVPTIADTDGTLLDEKIVANWLLRPDETPRPDSYVDMWVHESCPPQYKDIAMYHELVEAELELIDNISRLEGGHDRAVAATDAYAKQHLGPEEYEAYKQWERRTLGDEIVDRRST